MKILKPTLASVLLVALLWSPGVRAQSDVMLNALTIELWPEYDRPSMLVILRGTLAPSVKLPTSVTVRIPASSGGPFAVASQDAGGNLLSAQFVTTPQMNTIAVTLQAIEASFQVEYYDSELKIVGESREYAFQWAVDYPVTAATLRVQEPIDARGLSAEPPVTLAGSSDLGLNYYTASLGALTAGQSVRVRLRYSKATATLSVERAPQAAAVVVATPAATQSVIGMEAAVRYGLAGTLALASLGLVAWGVVIWRRGQETYKPRARVRRVSASQVATLVTPPDTTANRAARFCTQCGQPLLTNDRFCRQCGSPAPMTQAE